jgi:hypothetical protein
MIVTAAVLFVVVGMVMIAARNDLAHVQSLFAAAPSCPAASWRKPSAFLLAAAVLAAWRFGPLASR